MNWKYINSSYLFKSHLASEEIAEKIKDNLFERYISKFPDVSTEEKEKIKKLFFLEEPKSRWVFDMPGIISTKRNYHHIYLSNNFFIRIPSTDFQFIYSLIEASEPRKEIGTDYYKIHGFRTCLCLTAQEKDVILAQMKPMIFEASAIADAENFEFNEAIKSIENILVAKRKTSIKNNEEN